MALGGLRGGLEQGLQVPPADDRVGLRHHGGEVPPGGAAAGGVLQGPCRRPDAAGPPGRDRVRKGAGGGVWSGICCAAGG